MGNSRAASALRRSHFVPDDVGLRPQSSHFVPASVVSLIVNVSRGLRAGPGDDLPVAGQTEARMPMSAPTCNVELFLCGYCRSWRPVGGCLGWFSRASSLRAGLELLLGNLLDFAQVQLAGSKQGQLIHSDETVLAGDEEIGETLCLHFLQHFRDLLGGAGM